MTEILRNRPIGRIAHAFLNVRSGHAGASHHNSHSLNSPQLRLSSSLTSILYFDTSRLSSLQVDIPIGVSTFSMHSTKTFLEISHEITWIIPHVTVHQV